MPRVLGIDIPGRKQLEYSLRYIYGIGPSLAATTRIKTTNQNPTRVMRMPSGYDFRRLLIGVPGRQRPSPAWKMG